MYTNRACLESDNRTLHFTICCKITVNEDVATGNIHFKVPEAAYEKMRLGMGRYQFFTSSYFGCMFSPNNIFDGQSGNITIVPGTFSMDSGKARIHMATRFSVGTRYYMLSGTVIIPHNN